jgi:hypothetical protein
MPARVPENQHALWAEPAPTPTGDGGAAAFLHGPSRLFVNVIPMPTTTPSTGTNAGTTNASTSAEPSNSTDVADVVAEAGEAKDRAGVGADDGVVEDRETTSRTGQDEHGDDLGDREVSA